MDGKSEAGDSLSSKCEQKIDSSGESQGREDGLDAKPGESCWDSSEDSQGVKACAPEQEKRFERGQGDSTTQRVVGFDYKPVDEGATEEFLCYICHLIARKPTKVECCGNIFCEACITTQTECPLCRKKDFRLMIDKLVERKINGMRVFCPNHEKGCKWCGEVRSVEQHLQDPALTNQEEIERCQYQQTTCKKCDQVLVYADLRQHEEKKCDHRVVACEYHSVGCQFKDSKVRMIKHTQESMQEHLDLLRKFVKKRERSFIITGSVMTFLLVCCIIASIICISQSRVENMEEKIDAQCNTTGIKELEERIDKMEKIGAQCNTTGIKELEERIDKMEKIGAQCNTTGIKCNSTELEARIDKMENMLQQKEIKRLLTENDKTIANLRELKSKTDKLETKIVNLQKEVNKIESCAIQDSAQQVSASASTHIPISLLTLLVVSLCAIAPLMLFTHVRS